MLSRNTTYLDILKREFKTRTTKRPQYSLRSFAKFLGVMESRISEIFAGKQGISKAVAVKICERLNLNDIESEYFCLSVESHFARSKQTRETAQRAISDFFDRQIYQIPMEDFNQIEDWYFLALFELSHASDFICNVENSAKRLNLDIELTRESLQKLTKLGLMVEEGGVFRPVYADVCAMERGVMGGANHKQIWERAKRAMDELENTNYFDSLNLLVSEDQVEEIIEDIRKFQDKLIHKIESRAGRSRLYNLSVHFFRLDRSD